MFSDNHYANAVLRRSRRKERQPPKPKRVFLCQCDLIHDTEKQARNCSECGPQVAYLCAGCNEPKTDYDAAVRCCAEKE